MVCRICRIAGAAMRIGKYLRHLRHARAARGWREWHGIPFGMCPQPENNKTEAISSRWLNLIEQNNGDTHSARWLAMDAEILPKSSSGDRYPKSALQYPPCFSLSFIGARPATMAGFSKG